MTDSEKLALATEHLKKVFLDEGWQSTADVLEKIIGKDELKKLKDEYWENKFRS